MVHLEYDAIARLLNAAGFRADVRGEGAGRFVFAEAEERAVEISASGTGIWVEFWDGGDSPSFDRTFPTVDAAATDVSDWLSGRAI